MHRRAVVNGPKKPLRFENNDLAPIPSGFIRIKISFSGVCRSDLHTRDDGSGKLRSRFGEENYKKIVPGHEISGHVQEMGPGVDGTKYRLDKGDRVVVYACVGCQECPLCLKGRNNLCQDEKALLNVGKNPDLPGGFQTHIDVAPKYVVKIPDDVPLATACMLTCGGGTAYSALSMLREAVEFGAETTTKCKARILIIGAGSLGLWATRIAKYLYEDKIHLLVADINKDKLSAAGQAGADELIDFKSQSVPENVILVTRHGPIHGAVDFVGTTDTVSIGVGSLAKNGAMVVVGLEDGEIRIPVRVLVVQQINLRGCIVFDMDQLRALLKLVAEKNIEYPNVVTFSLDQVNTALDLLEKGQINGRALLKQE